MVWVRAPGVGTGLGVSAGVTGAVARWLAGEARPGGVDWPAGVDWLAAADWPVGVDWPAGEGSLVAVGVGLLGGETVSVGGGTVGLGRAGGGGAGVGGAAAASMSTGGAGVADALGVANSAVCVGATRYRQPARSPPAAIAIRNGARRRPDMSYFQSGRSRAMLLALPDRERPPRIIRAGRPSGSPSPPVGRDRLF